MKARFLYDASHRAILLGLASSPERKVPFKLLLVSPTRH